LKEEEDQGDDGWGLVLVGLAGRSLSQSTHYRLIVDSSIFGRVMMLPMSALEEASITLPKKILEYLAS
jgi:DeoR/GlpR family transcriptional regulator of sugar metabolism